MEVLMAKLKNNTIDEFGNETNSQGQRLLAESRSLFETEEQRRKRLNQKYLDNVDKVLRPKKPKKV
jgi:hypothetical protein